MSDIYIGARAIFPRYGRITCIINRKIKEY